MAKNEIDTPEEMKVAIFKMSLAWLKTNFWKLMLVILSILVPIALTIIFGDLSFIGQLK